MTLVGGDPIEIWFERRKWPDTPHYGHPAWILGEDDLGVWCEVRAGLPWHRGETLLGPGQFDAVVLVSQTGFIAWFWPEGGDLDLYVDIVTNIQRSESAITAVDLDLDVTRRRDDGTVELVDQDEFALHQVELQYPHAEIEHAERVAALVLEMARRGEAPFDGVATATWRAMTTFR